MHDAARAFLQHLGARVAHAARVGKLAKAGGADDDKDDPAVAVASDADYDSLGATLQPHLADVAKDAGKLGLEQVGIDGDALEAMLAQVNARAVAWAGERSGEFVTAVSETTRARVRELVARAEEEGWSNDTLADELAGDGVFGDVRAEMIARTETAFADVAGNLEGWKASGVVAGKRWITSQNGGECDECAALDSEEVPLDDEFPGGDPPLHPRCECDVLPVLSEE